MMAVLLLLAGWPHVDDVRNFPPLWLCTQAMNANREYRDRVEFLADMQLSKPREERLRERYAEAWRLYQVWDKLDSCHRSLDKVGHLMDLKELLGPVDYWLGRMPNPLPVER